MRLQREAGPPEDHVGELLPHLDHYSNAALTRAGIVEYDVAANWKGIAENYNECLHCPGVHPELNALSDYMSGEGLYGAGAWCGGTMTLNDGAETMGKEGGHLDRPSIASLAEADLRTAPTGKSNSSWATRISAGGILKNSLNCRTDRPLRFI